MRIHLNGSMTVLRGMAVAVACLLCCTMFTLFTATAPARNRTSPSTSNVNPSPLPSEWTPRSPDCRGNFTTHAPARADRVSNPGGLQHPPWKQANRILGQRPH